VSDPMDVSFGRWLKSGLSRRRPPEAVRGRVLRAAASRQVAMDRHSARFYTRWSGRHRGVGFDAWSFGLAAQAAMDWFPGEMTTFRVAY